MHPQPTPLLASKMAKDDERSRPLLEAVDFHHSRGAFPRKKARATVKHNSYNSFTTVFSMPLLSSCVLLLPLGRTSGRPRERREHFNHYRSDQVLQLANVTNATTSPSSVSIPPPRLLRREDAIVFVATTIITTTYPALCKRN